MAWLAWHTGHLGGVGEGQRLATAQGRRVEIGVLVPYPTLLGLADTPGQLDGFGPIPASVARRLAAAGTWRRILTDPATGRVLDYGRTRYRPPQDLIDHVIARDRTCRGIGCDRPARSCQIDHTIPYPDGPTAEGNTGPFCDRQPVQNPRRLAGPTAGPRPVRLAHPHRAHLHQTPRPDRAHHRRRSRTRQRPPDPHRPPDRQLP
jgi:hypothetical protein